MIINIPFLHVQAFYLQCETYGSLTTIAKQFSVNTKDLCDILFDFPNKTNVMIVNLGKWLPGRFEDFKE